MHGYRNNILCSHCVSFTFAWCYCRPTLLNLLWFRSSCHRILHSHSPYCEFMADVTIIMVNRVFIFRPWYLLYLTVFLKVFKRVSWWSFRASIPFSLLCLILLTHFHKTVSFHPNMLNYLNTTLTFGKQTKDNFISRKVQCRPTHSFIFSFSCPLFLRGESRGQKP